MSFSWHCLGLRLISNYCYLQVFAFNLYKRSVSRGWSRGLICKSRDGLCDPVHRPILIEHLIWLQIISIFWCFAFQSVWEEGVTWDGLLVTRSYFHWLSLFEPWIANTFCFALSVRSLNERDEPHGWSRVLFARDKSCDLVYTTSVPIKYLFWNHFHLYVLAYNFY